MFEIEFLGELVDSVYDAELGPHRAGRIRFNLTETETFLSALGYWTEDDYRRQWRDGGRRIVAGLPESCLVTSLDDPREVGASIRYWALFRERERVFIEEHILSLDEQRSFDPSNPYALVGTLNESPTENVVPFERNRLLRRVATGAPSTWAVELEDFLDWTRLST